MHQNSLAAAYSGHLQQATLLSQRAVNLAHQSSQTERAALFKSGQAVRESLFEKKQAARRSAEAALKLSTGRDVEYGAAFALAMADDLSRAQTLTSDLEKRFPDDTAVKFDYAPSLHALLAFRHGNSVKAMELLQVASPYEQAEPPSSF